MPAYPRHEIVADDRVGLYHCIVRCVRRAFLCGDDPVSGKNHDHRKEWIRLRLQELAAVFGIDVCGYAVMSNHFHVVLRVRPDLAQGWSDEEVALRWRLLYRPRDETTGLQTEPGQQDLNIIMSGPARVVQLRDRLASLSWFMRCLNEPIARAANREDNCSGRFWQGRFRSVVLLDEAAVLACSVYVDLNPIRAGVAGTPEESEFTVEAEARPRRSRPKLAARASDRGYLPIELEKYLSLVDWTGRELRAGSRGTIPGPLSPILDRLGQSGECWLETVRHFGRWFKRAAGGRDSLAAAAMRCGRRWFQGQCAAKIAFQ